ncbi:MAG TPA: C1 family peptidase [Phototrophicaceae bacterium]|nr:C1 family peptidase [Phototrophicaceae bacterium]
MVGTVNELSALGSRALGCYDGQCPEPQPVSESLSTPVDPATDWVSGLSVPASFDWHARPDGKNWLTGVRNQSTCGSCWAFAAVGAVEAAIKIGTADAALAPEPNLSEQYLVSSCVNFSSGNCAGGHSNSALAYIQTNGIVDEACMPYTAADANTCTRCSDWNTRLTTIKTIGTAWSNTVNKNYIQQNLVARGPVVVYLGMSNLNQYWDNGIYRCNKDHNDPGGSTSIDHAVVAVGYNDDEQYWLIRNSWGGGWNGTGYFKVGYGECNIDSTFMAWAMQPVAPPTLVAPINHAITTNPAVTFTWTTSNSPLETGYNLRIGISPNPNSSGPWLVDTTTTQTSYGYTFTAGGTYYWHLRTATDPTAATASVWKTGSVVLKGQIPSHDQFVNARAISDFPYYDVAYTHLATLQTGEKIPDCGANDGKSVWYKYVANVGNAVTVDTQGSNFDTVLSVWRGTTLTGLTPAACNNDDATYNPQSALTFTPTVGDTYYIRVSGKNQTVEDQLNLNVSLGAPINNAFAAPQLITPPFAYTHRINTTTADFNAAELTPTCAANAGKTVWYKYPLATSSSLYFTTTGSDFTPALSLWKQTGSETPVQVACNRNNGANGITFIDYQAEPATYYLLVADVNNVGGNLVFQMTEPLTTPLPVQPLGGVQVASDKPAFSWNSVPGAARYNIQVSTSTQFAVPIETATGTSYTPAMPLLPNSYYWRVRAVGTFGNNTVWSAPQAFTVISPADAAPGQNVSTNAYRQLTWGPVNWATAYEIQVDITPTFATYNQYWVNQDQKVPLTATVYGLQNGLYYWRVRAQKADRTWGAWSAVGTFVINAAGRDGQTGG